MFQLRAPLRVGMKCGWILSTVCLLTASMSAEANRWTRIGPFAPGGEPYAVGFSKAGTGFAASSAGLFKTVDGGKSWVLLDGAGDALINSIALDGLATVYAGTDRGLIRSDDGGATWKALNFRPGNQSVYPVVAGGGRVYALQSGQLSRSSDRGEGWVSGAGPDFLVAVAVDPRDGRVIYGATPSGLYNSTDGGANWVQSLIPSLSDPGVTAVAVDPTHPTTVYAAGREHVFRSDDAGDHWVMTSPFLSQFSFGIAALAVDFESPSTLYAVTFGNTFEGNVFRTRDRGTTWSKLSIAGADGVVAIDPGPPSTVYLGLATGEPQFKGGFIKSTDQGANWSPVGAPLLSFHVSDFAFERGRPGVVYTLTGRGIWKTVDGGATWFPANAHLFDPDDPDPDPIWALAADTSPAPALYVATSNGVVFKSTDGAANWSLATLGLPSNSSHVVFALAVDPVDRDTVYAASSTVYKTINGGLTWSPASAGPGPFFASALLVDATDHSTVYAADTGGDILRSRDGGAIWQPIYSHEGDKRVFCLAVDPRSPSTIYAGTYDVGTAQGDVVKTTDGGATWHTAADGLPGWSVRSVVVDPLRSATVYAATLFGVYRSQDGGASWFPFLDGMSRFSRALAFDPTSPRTLFLGADIVGAFRTEVSEEETCAADFRTLCLSDRFRVQAKYRERVSDQQKSGCAYRATRESGFLGFGLPDPCPEGGVADVAIKVVDGRSVNGQFWIFGGGLSDLQYSVEFTDTATGARKTWLHAEGPVASFADTSAFQGSDSVGVTRQPRTAETGTLDIRRRESAGSAVPCATSETAVCIGDRFLVEARWRAPDGGAPAVARAANMFRDDAAFWFFGPSNVELEVKLVDGRGLNGKFWIFCGSLTNVEFTLTVTDTQTGAVKTYFSPQGQLASIADTSAF